MDRLLLDARTVQRRRGGIGRMVEGLVRALLRVAPGLEIHLVAGRKGVPGLGDGGARVREVRVDAGTVDLRFEAELLPTLVRELRPEAYHATCFALPEERLACRTVVTLHDACVRRFPELVRPGLRELLDRATVAALRTADAVAAPSEFARAELATAYAVPPLRIEVIPNGVEEDFFAPPGDAEVEDSRTRLGISERYWLVVGAEEERKGLPEAIAGYALHARRIAGAPWPLLIAGGRGGGARLNAQACAESAGGFGLVRSLGYVSEGDLRVLYHGAAGVLCLSRYEGFGMPALEALAAGAPTIVADGSSLAEVVGTAALIVPPRDPEAVAEALDRVRSDPGMVTRLRTAGPARARRFTWEEAARRYLRLYGA